MLSPIESTRGSMSQASSHLPPITSRLQTPSEQSDGASMCRSRLTILPQLLFEPTSLSRDTPLSTALEGFYRTSVHVDELEIRTCQERCRSVMDQLKKALVKSSGVIGMNFLKPILAGPLFDGLLINDDYWQEADVFLPMRVDKPVTTQMKVKSTRLPIFKNLEPGYATVRIVSGHGFRKPKYQSEDLPHEGTVYTAPASRVSNNTAINANKRDFYRYGRSVDGNYLSPVKCAFSLHGLMRQVISDPPKTFQEAKTFRLLPFDKNCPCVAVDVAPKLRLNLIPSAFLIASKDRDFTVKSRDVPLLATRPFPGEPEPDSDILWRVQFPEREAQVLKHVEGADRGHRKQALRMLIAITRREPTFCDLGEFHLRQILLGIVDFDVDQSPRWQRDPLEECFLFLLQQLSRVIKAGKLEHFFAHKWDVMRDFPREKYIPMQNKLRYLLSDREVATRYINRLRRMRPLKQVIPPPESWNVQ